MKNKMDKISLIIGIIILIFIVAVSMIFGNSNNDLNSNTNSTNEENETVNVEEDNVSMEIKKKLQLFIIAAYSYNEVTGSSDNIFYDGTKEINKETKLGMTTFALYWEKKVTTHYKLTQKDVSKMETKIEKAHLAGNIMTVIKITDFDSMYNELFHEKVNYAFDDLNRMLPESVGMDKSQNRIYILPGMNMNNSPMITGITYNYDGKYYYAHVSGETYNFSEKKSYDSFKSLVTFDNDFRFISTVKE